MERSINILHTPLPTHRLAGKVAIITDGSGSIGVETAGRLLREGAVVSLVDKDAAALEAAVLVLQEALTTGEPLPSRILTTVADVTSEDGVQMYVRRTVDAFHSLDVAFLNADTSCQAKSLLETTVEDYERVMRVNVKSAFLGIKHTASAMKELGKGGSIILTSSIAGLYGAPGLISDSASKFALRGLALTAASELGELGIRVNTIHPNGVNAPIFRIERSPEDVAEVKVAMPLRRFAQAGDIAGLVSFLAGDDSRFMTGGSLKIDVSGNLVPLTVIKGAGSEFIALPNGENATTADFHSIRTKTDSPAYVTSGFYKIEAGPERPAHYNFEEAKYVLSGQIDILDEATGITHHLVPGDYAFFHVGSKVKFSTKSTGFAFYVVTRPVRNPHTYLEGREESTKSRL